MFGMHEAPTQPPPARPTLCILGPCVRHHRAEAAGWLMLGDAEEALLTGSGGFRRLFVRVASTRLFDDAGASGHAVFLRTQAGNTAQAESETQPAAHALTWQWSTELEPTSGCTHVLLSVHRRRFLGPQLIGQAAVPLDSLADQRAHALTLRLSPPGAPHDAVGELAVSLLYADYAQLRTVVLGGTRAGTRTPAASSAALDRQRVTTTAAADGATGAIAERATHATPSSTNGGGRASPLLLPPPSLPVPASVSVGAGGMANASAVGLASAAGMVSDGGAASAGDAAGPRHLADGELGFLYVEQERQVVSAELSAEKVKLLRAQTESAGARLARNILRAMVGKLVAKRRALQGELRRMEAQRATLSVQLSLLHRQASEAAAGAEGEAEAEAGGPFAAELASLHLLDEAEQRHARRLHERRSLHMDVVHSLQGEYIAALHTIKKEVGGPPALYSPRAHAWASNPLEATECPGAAREALMSPGVHWEALMSPGVPGPSCPPTRGWDRPPVQASQATPAKASLLTAWGTDAAGCCTAADGATSSSATGVGSGDAEGVAPTGAGAEGATPRSVAHGMVAGSPELLPTMGAAQPQQPQQQQQQQQQQRELFLLEKQLQNQRDVILAKTAALRALEGGNLQLRGAAAHAEELQAQAEARAAAAVEAEARAVADAAAARAEASELRVELEALSGDAARWQAQRAEMRRDLERERQRTMAEAEDARAEAQRTIRALEERLAFETASRELDRKEARQLGAALQAQRRGGGGGGTGGAGGGGGGGGGDDDGGGGGGAGGGATSSPLEPEAPPPSKPGRPSPGSRPPKQPPSRSAAAASSSASGAVAVDGVSPALDSLAPGSGFGRRAISRVPPEHGGPQQAWSRASPPPSKRSAGQLTPPRARAAAGGGARGARGAGRATSVQRRPAASQQSPLGR